jgi:hypothetical protein
MADPWSTYATSLDDPLANAAVITPNDGIEFPITSRAIMLNKNAEYPLPVSVVFMNDVTATVYLVSGVIHWLRVKRIRATGTADQLLTFPSFTILW